MLTLDSLHQVPEMSIGTTGGGAPLHNHEAAWSAVVYGKKRWYVTPPWANAQEGASVAPNVLHWLYDKVTMLLVLRLLMLLLLALPLLVLPLLQLLLALFAPC